MLNIIISPIEINYFKNFICVKYQGLKFYLFKLKKTLCFYFPFFDYPSNLIFLSIHIFIDSILRIQKFLRSLTSQYVENMIALNLKLFSLKPVGN